MILLVISTSAQRSAYIYANLISLNVSLKFFSVVHILFIEKLHDRNIS